MCISTSAVHLNFLSIIFCCCCFFHVKPIFWFIFFLRYTFDVLLTIPHWITNLFKLKKQKSLKKWEVKHSSNLIHQLSWPFFFLQWFGLLRTHNFTRWWYMEIALLIKSISMINVINLLFLIETRPPLRIHLHS